MKTVLFAKLHFHVLETGARLDTRLIGSHLVLKLSSLIFVAARNSISRLDLQAGDYSRLLLNEFGEGVLVESPPRNRHDLVYLSLVGLIVH